ncbi:zinc finger CCHC domain-containing protein 8 [Anguilla anguilla]|uniref:zinc finger CCHC domain-containing protein 8 n=1 Tax=Anguilla anguilla TaxID=7936 RepID=UPI0015B07B67|nr:zinc finger CCHC domain-containing protein 8 [Anguilla anguilla]
MAEFDFGDSELFQQLDEGRTTSTHIRFEQEEEDPEEVNELREKLEECEETINRLQLENQDLKRKLNILARPSGLNLEDSKLDGPLLQILFANNDISKQCRQEIEDCIYGLVQKHMLQQKQETEKSSFHLKPQPSSFVLEEDHKVKISDPIKKIRDAFSMVGSVLYFTSFCLDRLGQPLLNENPQLTDGWEVPKYQQVFCQVVAAEGQDLQMKDNKRPKPCCFNCGAEDHQLRDCPKPKDMARINEKRKEFSGGNNQSNQRYHAEEVEERFGKYKPGIVSEELLGALGVTEHTLPPFIYRMRQLGYPPGWLKEAELESSGLALYDGKVSSDGEIAEDDNYQSHKISYDVSKLVNFPGFNVSTPADITDDWRLYGSVPMQAEHMKKNFAAYLSTNYPMPGSNCNKRAHESDSTPRQTKKRRSDVNSSRCSDMEVDSGSETPRSSRSSDSFQFQPPLPPGSPSFGSPPPLPRGTPPATPTPPPLPKDTPPSTPANGSPALRGRGCEEVGEEDALTLEELEEQQRLIWEALENADTATNSDSETPAVGTPIISSSGASSPAHIDTETEVEEEEEAAKGDEEAMKQEEEATKGDEEAMEEEEAMKMEEEAKVGVEEEEEEEGVEKSERSEETSSRNGEGRCVLAGEGRAEDEEDEVKVVGEVTGEPEPPQASENASAPGPVCRDSKTETPPGEAGKVASVPHRSRFAAGIIPFEDTPEYKDVAEATGVYLRIRDLLKFSPRNQAKNKK